VKKFIYYVDKTLFVLEAAIIAVCGVGILATLFYGALARYLLHVPFPEEPELAWFFHTWLVFMGVSVVCRGSGDHPYVGAIRDKRGKSYKRFIWFLSIVYAIILIYSNLSFYGIYKLQKTILLRLPMYTFYLAMLLGLLFMIIRYTIKIITLGGDNR